MESLIYHITTQDEWEASVERGVHVAPSLEEEGFIHCSGADQVERSLNKYFHGIEQVLVVRIDPELLTSPLKYEGGGEQTFPHIYGPLNIDAVTAVTAVEPDDDGTFHFTPGS